MLFSLYSLTSPTLSVLNACAVLYSIFPCDQILWKGGVGLRLCLCDGGRPLHNHWDGVRETARIGIQLTEVLDYLHEQKPPIIFRDVKPANIMRTPRGRLYLVDFGIARLFSPQKTRDTGPLGSPGFAAPEQYGKAQSTVQTDIYGLGATLQALLQSSDTFDQEQGTSVNETPSEIAGKTHGSRQGTPGKRAIPRPLQKLLDRMLEYDVAKRPKHMSEVRHRLEMLPINIPLMLLTIFRRAFWGLVIGSFPYVIVPLLLLFSWVPVLGSALTWVTFVLAALSFGLWPVVLGLQVIAAIALLRSKRHRLMGFGILFGLAVLFLAAALGWLPWPWSAFSFDFHFRIT